MCQILLIYPSNSNRYILLTHQVRTIVVTDDESQPLLSNPDVISLSAERDQRVGMEFLRSINPIDMDVMADTGLVSWFKKAYEIFKVKETLWILHECSLYTKDLT